MNKEATNHLVIENTDAKKVRQVLSAYPKRYRHYVSENNKGIWYFLAEPEKDEQIRLLLVDKEFDKVYGNAKPESAVWHIDVEEQGENVLLSYQQKWQKNVIIMGIIYLVLSACCLGLSIFGFCVSDLLVALISMGVFVFSLVLLAVYLWRLRKHDAMARQVFCEILSRTFKVSEMQTSAE